MTIVADGCERGSPGRVDLIARGRSLGFRARDTAWGLGELAAELVPEPELPARTPATNGQLDIAISRDAAAMAIRELLEDIVAASGGELTMEGFPKPKTIAEYRNAVIAVPPGELRKGLSCIAAGRMRAIPAHQRVELINTLRAEGRLTQKEVLKEVRRLRKQNSVRRNTHNDPILEADIEADGGPEWTEEQERAIAEFGKIARDPDDPPQPLPLPPPKKAKGKFAGSKKGKKRRDVRDSIERAIDRGRGLPKQDMREKFVRRFSQGIGDAAELFQPPMTGWIPWVTQQEHDNMIRRLERVEDTVKQSRAFLAAVEIISDLPDGEDAEDVDAALAEWTGDDDIEAPNDDNKED